jgi:hypothetical protein
MASCGGLATRLGGCGRHPREADWQSAAGYQPPIRTGHLASREAEDAFDVEIADYH